MEASDQQDSSFLSPKSSIVKSEGTPRVRKVRKRRSRAVARPLIRQLSADKSTFRDIVLQLTGIPSTSSSSPPPPPPPPPPLSLLACAHPSHPFSNTCTSPFANIHTYPHHDPISFANPTFSLPTSPSYPFSNTCASPFSNHSLHNSSLSFANPMNSPNDSLSFANPMNSQHDTLSFANPMNPLSTSHVLSNNAPPSTPSSHSSLCHSSPYPSLDEDAISDIKLSQTLGFLEALKQSLLQIKSLGEGCGSFNFGFLGQYNHDMNSNGGSNDCIDGVDLEPLCRSQVDQYTPKSINGECVPPIDSLDIEPLQNSG